MNFLDNKKKFTLMLTFGFLVITGTYNAVVINSESSISGDIRFVKRLDEVYGVVRSGRDVAAAMSWKKIPAPVAAPVYQAQLEQPRRQEYAASTPNVADSGYSEPVSEAAYNEDLNLTLEKAENSSLWDLPPKLSEVSGSLTAQSGVIEGLEFSLPRGKSLPDGISVSVSFAGMVGNSFQYEIDGNQHNGIIIQIDKNLYSVRLTDGPLDSTVLMFRGQASMEDELNQEQTKIEEKMMADTLDDGSNVEMPVVDENVAQVEAPAEVQAEQQPIDEGQAQQLNEQDMLAQEQAVQEQQAQAQMNEQQQAM